jgi:hypothetical protein
VLIFPLIRPCSNISTSRKQCLSSPFLFFYFFLLRLGVRAASNSAYSGYPKLWILRYPAHRYRAVSSSGFEPTTLWLRVRCPNHSATMLHIRPRCSLRFEYRNVTLVGLELGTSEECGIEPVVTIQLLISFRQSKH